MPTYRYTGDLPTVFITLRTANGTWVPSKGDEIEWHEALAHPLLELVEDVDEDDAEVDEPLDSKTVPAVPETKVTPVTADEKEN